MKPRLYRASLAFLFSSFFLALTFIILKTPLANALELAFSGGLGGAVYVYLTRRPDPKGRG